MCYSQGLFPTAYQPASRSCLCEGDAQRLHPGRCACLRPRPIMFSSATDRLDLSRIPELAPASVGIWSEPVVRRP